MMGLQPLSGSTLMDYLLVAATQTPDAAATGLWAKWRRAWRKLIHFMTNVTATLVWRGVEIENPADVTAPTLSPPVTASLKAYSEGVSDSQVADNRELRMSDANVFISALDLPNGRKPEVGALLSLGQDVHSVVTVEQWPRGGPIVVMYVMVCRTRG